MSRYEFKVDSRDLNRYYIYDNVNKTEISFFDMVALLNHLNEKMNHQAFKLYRHDVVSFGKAVELSNMSYKDFLEYCDDNGYPFELME